MAATTMEERVAALENEIVRLRTKVEGMPFPVMGRTRPDFLDTMVGIHANSPLFEEVVRSVAAEREQEREEVRRLTAEDEASA